MAIRALPVIAVGRPALLEHPVTRSQPGRDSLFATDVSDSMDLDHPTDDTIPLLTVRPRDARGPLPPPSPRGGAGAIPRSPAA